MNIFVAILFKHFWVGGILATIINAFVMRHRSKEFIVASPELTPGYNKLFYGMMFFGNIPWIIAGIGVLIGTTDGIFDYLNPRDLNPMVLIFHFSIIILWILFVWWIYFGRGAEFIEDHPGFLQVHLFGRMYSPSARQIKVLFPLILIGGIACMILLWMIDIPFPS